MNKSTRRKFLYLIVILALSGCATTDQEAQREAADPPATWKLIATPGKAKSVIVEESAMSRGDYEKIVRELCSPNAFCWVDFWSDEKLVPRSGGIDITDRQCQAWIANYVNNPSTRYRNFNWDPC